MDSTKILNKCCNLLNNLKNGDSDINLVLDELFEKLIPLINIYKVRFDVESFIRFADVQRKSPSLETVKGAEKDKTDSGLNNKKNFKRLLNFVVLYLLELLQDEKHFEASLDRLVDLLDADSFPKTGKNTRKSTEFMHLFLLSLFYGNYYHLGIVQHYLLNSRHTLNLPQCLSNVIKHMDRTGALKRLLNRAPSKDEELDERFEERFLIFVTKLNTPEMYRKNQGKAEVLKIPRKDLGLRNPVTQKSTSGYDDDSDDDQDGYVNSDEDSNVSSDSVEEEEYGNDYIKLWQAILDQMIYRVSTRNLVIILESLPTKAFPYIYSPLKVANFLHTLSIGAADVVINSLNCLFELILYYNLTDQVVASFVAESRSGSENQAPYELDWFYKRLDRLIDFEYLSSGSSVVLLSLVERALNSSMLPNKLVSYFIKRLVATSTVVDTACCNSLLVIALRLLQKHHHQLVHQISTHAAANGPNDSLFLHELYLLLHHFNNDTIKIVGVYFTHLKNKITFSLGDFIGAQKDTKHIEKSKNTHYNPFRANIQNTTTVSRSFFR
ncbi:conserved hypothetical protein [Theileria orientalis strain Shintoku]|uniref:CCAAT-binding factor domain-containing protein n=1 Tax=Theileria orientalis strain Shintoku TaxID=869250 RepID=J7M8S3_THEOR|nr:conserved hypothetical protein [Theileria orientalis strain Shintoku]BAM42518.1 conserved hypothetical protein [Theileria orientalis strain Shintoku]|eukprot:XP_009692819.1 conserved hypothetical protein [Theileria orientalis strain Shintoku]